MMADPGCSGTQPFKTLVNHHDHDRTLPSHLTTRPNNAPNTFRAANTNSRDHGRFTSFMGGGDLSSAPIPTLAAPPPVASHMTGPITSRQPLFPTSQHPYTPQAHSHPPQQGWAQEYLRQSSPTIQNDYASHKPGITQTNHSIQRSSPGLVNNSYNGAQLPYSGPSFSIAAQAAAAPGHGVEISEWMGAHRPSGVALDDVDQVLNQISGELEELVVEPGMEGDSRSTAEKAEGGGSQSPAENQTAEATESEATHSRPGQPTAVSHLARKILQAVDHEDDEKWKDSSFLELMRDFRDGRKDVSENTIEVVTTA